MSPTFASLGIRNYRRYAAGALISNTGNIFSFVEKPITCGAGRYALTPEFLFGFYSKIFCCGTGRYNDCFRNNFLLFVYGNFKRSFGEIYFTHNSKTDIRSKTDSLFF